MLLSPSNQCGGSSSGLLKCLPSSLDIFDAAVQLPMGRSRLSSFLLYYIFVILSTPFFIFLTIFSQSIYNPPKNHLPRRCPLMSWSRGTKGGFQGKDTDVLPSPRRTILLQKNVRSRQMRLHPLHFGLPQASILRMRQPPQKQLYLFQFLLECSFHGCILQVTLATGVTGKR